MCFEKKTLGAEMVAADGGKDPFFIALITHALHHFVFCFVRFFSVVSTHNAWYAGYFTKRFELHDAISLEG